ncbi:MAG TPA: mechanosensitive ion channel family protein [Acidimicrobiia bacterium]|jgi:moderate conductance mechanosensitive channel|nr:mechanosensitive ion channel family protein [Acidimicrobiia bacterium]
MSASAVLAASVNDPGLVNACGPKGEQSWLCSTVYRITGDSHAADVADALAKPIRIIVILLLAWIAVRITRVLTGRLVKHLSGGVEKLASMRGGVAFVDTGPMPQARRTQRAETIGAVLRSVVTIVIWSIAVLTILEILGINLAPLIAGAGIAGVALGFGAQSLVRDFLSGMFMLMEDQFGVGDVVDTGVATGTVEGVSLRTTRLRDIDGVVWHIPNGTILRVGNKSQQWSRAVVDVPVAFEADTGVATDVIHGVAEGIWHEPDYASVILAEPSVLGVESLAPGRVVIRVVVRTQPQQQWRVERELRVRIKAALDAAGIALPSA